MLDCWREDPDDRPTFENLRDKLKEMENQHQVKPTRKKEMQWNPFYEPWKFDLINEVVV